MTSIYNTGTITVTNGNAVVTGSGTAWAVALVTGGMFSSVGMAVPIASVESDTSLTLAYDWPGTTASGTDYAIALENAAAASVVDLNTTLSRVLVTLSLAGITPDDSGSLTERDALTLAVGDKGFLFLHAEIGVAFAFYRWTGTAWDGPFAVANASGGAVSSIVAGANVSVDNTNPAIPVISATGEPLEDAIHGATGKTTPVDADELGIADSAASFGLKKLTWANLKATLKTYFDTIYVALTGAQTIAGVKTFSSIPVMSGGGIKFPATQVPSADANTLDDYEEGTWTPGVSFVTPGNLSVTYASQTGTYVKIGSLITFNFLVATSAFTYTTATGFFIITGFPFAMAINFAGSGTLLMQGWTRANYTGLMLETSNSTFMYANSMGSGQSMGELTQAHVATAGSIRAYGSGSYTI